MLKAQTAFSGFSVNNIEKAKEFYTRILGLTLVDESMGLRLQLPNGGMLFVYEKGSDHQPATFTILNFVVENINAAVDELANQGVQFEHYDNENGPQTDAKGIARGIAANMGPDIAWFKDPSGNIMSVLQEK